MENPDEKFLTILKKDFPNQYSYKEINGEITHLHIKFSPSLLPECVIDLEYLEVITTEYDPDIEQALEYERACFGDDAPIHDDFVDFLNDSQIRGVELWESEFIAIESLHRSLAIYYNIKKFHIGKHDIDSEQMAVCIRNGHVIAISLELPYGWDLDLDEISDMTYTIEKFSNLQYLFLYIEDSNLITKKEKRDTSMRFKYLAEQVDVEFYYDSS